MKKKILSLVFAICLIIPSALALTACGGGAKPFSVAGKTLKGTSEVYIVWKDGITTEEKQQFFLNNGIEDETELEERLNNNPYMTITFEYKEDGTSILKVSNPDGTPKQEDRICYFTQSKDLKTITNYRDAEQTQIIGEGLGELSFYKENFCLIMGEYEEVTIYIAFKQV